MSLHQPASSPRLYKSCRASQDVNLSAVHVYEGRGFNLGKKRVQSAEIGLVTRANKLTGNKNARVLGNAVQSKIFDESFPIPFRGLESINMRRFRSLQEIQSQFSIAGSDVDDCPYIITAPSNPRMSLHFCQAKEDLRLAPEMQLHPKPPIKSDPRPPHLTPLSK